MDGNKINNNIVSGNHKGLRVVFVKTYNKMLKVAVFFNFVEILVKFIRTKNK